ncbi:nuclear transport factor 2 family protein [Lactiplantibacillus pingfangensis]|uniref:nuclear transport factor 2 family protein n=1 Tax=Lactiplantibacillus pingfangensis TaxID=2559915 RepID=UPI0010F58BF6|nr:nuclear transport factor 2 family protein [Lactiplantibacillus pingfangensis]
MTANETLIRQYFNCWLTQDFPPLTTFFTKDCVYRECYGATYRGIAELKQWLDHQLASQTVLTWEIQRVLPVSDNCVVVTWFFKAKTQTVSAFDGVSVIDFEGDKISRLTEYETKHNTYRPYAS